ncbi:MAG TPA: hypothetical protein VK697_11330 [Methylomirabilota bacterium]|nr:hypothetical protein [Methylomirabilota bacterium]
MRSAALLTIVLVALLMGGCSGPPSASIASSASPSAPPSTLAPSATPSRPLVTVETRGGMCAQGACDSTIAIEADGRVHAIAPAPAELGTVPDRGLEALNTEIAQADFAALTSHPFTGTCPIAFDGQETVYTFSIGSDTQRIASCEVIIDPAAPLFVAVTAALADAGHP